MHTRMSVMLDSDTVRQIGTKASRMSIRLQPLYTGRDLDDDKPFVTHRTTTGLLGDPGTNLNSEKHSRSVMITTERDQVQEPLKIVVSKDDLHLEKRFKPLMEEAESANGD